MVTPIARHLLRAKDLVDARYPDPLTVVDLARAAGLSCAHFSREFHRAFGEPPHRYLLTRRLERAAALLRTTPAEPSSVTSAPSPRRRSSPMTRIANTQFWVHDQDEAAAFYTGLLGWEVRSDVTIDDWTFRWLVVGPPTQPEIGLVLMPVPGPPMLDEASSDQLAELVAKGAGGTLFLETDDCQRDYDELSARGIQFNDPPTEQPYGIDTSFRDPSGNNIRLTQILEFSPSRGL